MKFVILLCLVAMALAMEEKKTEVKSEHGNKFYLTTYFEFQALSK
jgi:hypothetical protein